MRAKYSLALALCLGVALLFVSMLYPPWIAYTRNLYGGITELPSGYGFLFTQPEPKTPNVSIKIDFAGLFVEWFVILLGTAVCLILARRDKPDDDSKREAPDAETASRSQTPGASDS
jgi:hypothetical protein